MNDATIRSTEAAPLRGRSCLPVIGLSSLSVRWSDSARASLHPRRQLDQEAHAVAAGVVAGVLTAHVPGGPGDVDVSPWNVADELLEEGGGRDRSCLALRGEVGEVGDGALH